MKSTGEVMGIDEDFYLAYFKSQIGAGQKLNDLKNIFISVKNEDKQSISEIAKSFKENGYNLYTTKGTHDFLLREGISSNLVNKVAEGSPHVVEYIKQNKIDLVINTTEKKQAIIDSFTIRRTSVDLTSPIARALIGKKKGDYIEVSTPKGITSYEIKSVRFK